MISRNTGIVKSLSTYRTGINVIEEDEPTGCHGMDQCHKLFVPVKAVKCQHVDVQAQLFGNGIRQ